MINKLPYYILLLCFGLNAQAQQLFTNIPIPHSTGGGRVFEGVELDNNYYFSTTRGYSLNGVNYGQFCVFSTNTNGQILDSLVDYLSTGSDTARITTIQVEDNLLCRYWIIGKPDTIKYATFDFNIIRVRYDANLVFQDSLVVVIPPSVFGARSNLTVQKHKDKIYALVSGIDTAYTFPWDTPQDRIFVIDTFGNFLYQKKIWNQAYSLMGFITCNAGDNFITRLGDYDSTIPYNGSMLRYLDDSINFVRRKPELATYLASTGALDKYSEDKFTVAYVKDETPANLDDSLCVDLRDTSFNLIKRTCIPRDSIFNHMPRIPLVNKITIYDGHRKNSLFVGAMWPNSAGANGHFTISNLDSNLNIRWAKSLGGDFPYFIWDFYSTSDGGCLIMGERYNNFTEPVIFKISQQGLITNITSFAPSAQAFFTTYPNPSKGISYIKNPSNKAYELLVFSQEGKLVYQKQNIYDQLFSLDISAFASGTYFYKIMTSDGRSTSGKLLKE